MSDKQIEEIAKRINSELYGENCEKDIYGAIKWLSDRYELVNKNHVRDLYRFYNDMLERGNLAIGYTDRYDAKKELLESLFPTLKSDKQCQDSSD